jgi:LuxR family maltose regulon positive regulatory protein
MTIPSASGSAARPRLSRTAKFALPSQPPDHLRRSRLLDFLHQNIHRKLIMILAAAGYGKTSLAAHFVYDTDYPVTWLRLDETDRDLAAFAGNLVAALQSIFPAFQSLLPVLAAQPVSRPEDLASAFNREIESGLERYFVLVLDDFHLVEESEPVMRFFDAVLTGLPEQAHWVIVGRTVPGFRILPGLAARQQVTGLSEEHLRFTPAEVQALLQLRHHVALPDAEAEQLVADTEGWITGILLTSQLMWQGVSRLLQARKSESPLYAYLAEEVLDQQPDALRQFMLEAATLPDMEAAVCDAVLGRADSAELLAQLEARRLFVSAVGDELRAYQFHHLFRDFLLAKSRAQAPERLQVLQNRAADWYAAHGMVEAAVTFYLQAGALLKAAQLAEAQAKAMHVAGRHAALRRWAEQLAPIAHETPTLYLYFSKALSDAGDLAEAEAKLSVASEGFARREDAAGAVEAESHRSFLLYRRGQFEAALEAAEAAVTQARALRREVSVAGALYQAGKCRLALGQLPAAEESLVEAIALLKAANNRFDLAYVLNDLALVLRLRGQTTRTARVQQDSLALWRELAVPGPLALALNNIGWDLHMLGQYESALATYEEALGWAQRAGSARLEALIITGQADVFADLGDRWLAADYYRAALEKAQHAGDWSLAAYLLIATARMDRAAGNYVGALERLRRAGLISQAAQAETALANSQGLRGIILVEMGHVAEGRDLLNRVCVDLERREALVDLAQALLFRACAEYRAAAADASAQSLTDALTVAEKVGYDQMLVREALAARDVLEAHRARPDIGPHISALLARAETVGEVRARLHAAGVGLAEFTPVPAPPTPVEVRALGQSRILKDGADIPRADWETQRARELFLFLVDQTPVARERILQIFWPDKPAARAGANLRQSLYRLRRAFGYEVVVVTDDECRLPPGLALTYDVTRFEAAARGALLLASGDRRRLGALAAAAELYTGDYLADLAVDWALERRRALGELHVRVLLAYTDELMTLTRYGQAREVLNRALAAEPLRDELHERMLVCLAGMGRRHEVVDHYRRYRETLRAELGIDPSPETRALYSSLIE